MLNVELESEKIKDWSSASRQEYWTKILGPNPRIPTWLLQKHVDKWNWLSLSLWNPFSESDLYIFKEKIVWRFLATWYNFSSRQLTLYSSKLSQRFNNLENIGWKYYGTENPHLTAKIIADHYKNMPWTESDFVNRLSVEPPLSISGDTD